MEGFITTRILKGDICYSTDKQTLKTVPDGYLVCENGLVKGVFEQIPKQYQKLPMEDYSGKLIIPGLTDLHVHAPQYSFRGMKMDLELLDWLNTNTFPEESKYQDLEYAKRAYEIFVNDLRRGGTTRASIFATLHVPATKLLMELVDDAGIEAYVGKVNMDRNSPDYLCEANALAASMETAQWLVETQDAYEHVKPIITPRFIPTCSDELMSMLARVQKEFQVPVQSHLSENAGEIAWVRELVPESRFYGDAYDGIGLFGGEVPTIMAHCVHSTLEEMKLMKERGVYIAHCPQSNENLTSGVAPVRLYLDEDMKIGLGSDVAGGANLSIFRAMTDAIQVSKLRYRLLSEQLKPITMEEAFFMGTKGGGSFFGKVGSFEEGYECDALVLDESRIPHPQELGLKDRLERFLYLSGDDGVFHKFIKGHKIF
ncbi:MAG TPA: amidohydrolase family protein [Candidatus Pelethocola excrementipullorum]|nr:amidohydrolase family protein [Candidatus Pelethocola excrementipullorum]